MNLHHILKTRFGFASFRKYQEGICEAMVAGRDVFAVLPTSAGKSLCFQLPAIMRDGTTIVITPLISLMQDQVQAAKARGIRAAFTNSTQKVAEVREVNRLAVSGGLDLLYVSPERFVSKTFKSTLDEIDIGMIVLDESHCISQWGNSFRVKYLQAADMVKQFRVPVSAFTASVTIEMQEEIIKRLGLVNPYRVRASFNRSNLRYDVVKKTAPVVDQVRDFVRDHEGQAGIVYRTTRNNVENMTIDLQAMGIKALPYHAGLKADVREENQNAFLANKCQVAVATIAFGMGIDKPNIRWVLHVDLPKNLEGYYQETGRAGRDGLDSHCTLLYSRADIVQLRRFNSFIDDPEYRKKSDEKLDQMIRFAEADICRRKQVLGYFDEQHPGDCGNCDVCAEGYVNNRFEAGRILRKLFPARARYPRN